MRINPLVFMGICAFVLGQVQRAYVQSFLFDLAHLLRRAELLKKSRKSSRQAARIKPRWLQ